MNEFEVPVVQNIKVFPDMRVDSGESDVKTFVQHVLESSNYEYRLVQLTEDRETAPAMQWTGGVQTQDMYITG